MPRPGSSGTEMSPSITGKCLLRQMFAQGALLDAVLEVVRVRQGGDEVQAGGDVDARLVGVVDAQAVPLGRVPADALGARQAADAGHVHLDHVDAALSISVRNSLTSQISSPAAMRMGLCAESRP